MILKTRHRLETIEDVEEFYAAIQREHLTKALSEDRPYTYWTIELYDQANGIRGGGGLGILAADTRRVAEQMNAPLTLITPFYPSELHQKFENGRSFDVSRRVDYHDFGFELLDTVNIRCNKDLVKLEVIEKEFGREFWRLRSRILANFILAILAVTIGCIRRLRSGLVAIKL